MALTGFSVSNTCYADYNSAWDAYFSSIPTTTLSNGNLVSYQKNGALWVWQRVEVLPNGTQTISVAPNPVLPYVILMLALPMGLLYRYLSSVP